MNFHSARSVLFAFLLALVAITPSLAQSSSISGSRHDLSVSGGGPVTATTENQVCVFCHASHAAKPAVPLWNHTLSSTTTYSQYTSSTFVQTSPQTISERSKLCLSCHDGTVAMGQTIANGLISTKGALSTSATISDLRADHPFGFTMPAVDDGELKGSLLVSPPRTSDSAVKLYNNAIECVTCHEPHEPNRDTAVQFMVRSNTESALCTACHDTSRGVLSGWNSGAHGIATNTVALASGLPYTTPATVATNGCASCHAGHNTAGTGARLLRGIDSATCATCHGNAANVSPVLLNIVAETTKPYTHPSGVSGHDPAETLPVTNSRHAQCADCHNPHGSQTTSGAATPPALQRSLNGTSGISAADGLTVLRPAVNQYEVCFKCHGNSNNKPQNANYAAYGPTPFRLNFAGLGDPYNIRLDLQNTQTRHNVTQPSRPGISPSLRSAMLDVNGVQNGRSLQGPGSYLYCTDCHNNSAARVSNGTGPNGPHGSNYYHLLERRYEYDAAPGSRGAATSAPAYTPGVTGPYALCDKCHDVQALVNSSGATDTVFHKHWRHVVDQSASCSTCHASHGVQGGTATSNAHLVNFDTRIVGPDDKGRLEFESNSQQCFLTCHGVVHNPKKY